MTFASVPIAFEPQNGHAAGRGSEPERECSMDRKLPFLDEPQPRGAGLLSRGMLGTPTGTIYEVSSLRSKRSIKAET